MVYLARQQKGMEVRELFHHLAAMRAVIVELAALYQPRRELVISFRVRWHQLDQLGKIRRRFLLARISRA
jgi:hypothetical protein